MASLLEQFPMATDETAVADRAGGGTAALDHHRHRIRSDALDPRDMDFSGEEHVPKARKPYTITKQREKWTEDEHRRFLDALQLHGRAWRRIQEHIGTKTAVQIRSHAQKFFTKVVRESSSGSGSNTAGSAGAGGAPAIQIPPPRPKRKPAHPYPRKLDGGGGGGGGGAAKKAAPELKRLEKPPPLRDQDEEGSPTSVLTSAAAHMVVLRAEEGLGGGGGVFANSSSAASRSMPAVSAAGSDERGNGGGGAGSLASSVDGEEEEDACASPTTTAPYTAKVLGDANRVGSGAPILKLFGKTVVMEENLKTTDSSPASAAQATRTGSSPIGGAGAASPWNPWPAGSVQVQQLMYLVPQPDGLFVPLPWFGYNYNGGLPCAAVFYPQPQAQAAVAAASAPDHHHQQQQQQASEPLDQRRRAQREGSLTGSSMAGSSAAAVSDTAESLHRAAAVPRLTKCASSASCSLSGRGFVPYKRCAAESEAARPVAAPGEEADGEMTRLCL